MKRCLIVLCLILVILAQACPAVAEETTRYTLGEFSYELPSSWRYELDEATGNHYHYERNDYQDGIYLFSSVSALGYAPTEALEADILLDSTISALYAESENLEGIRFPFGDTCPHQLLTGKVIGLEGIDTLSCVWLRGENLYFMMFVEQSRSHEEQLAAFQEILNSLQDAQEAPAAHALGSFTFELPAGWTEEPIDEETSLYMDNRQNAFVAALVRTGSEVTIEYLGSGPELKSLASILMKDEMPYSGLRFPEGLEMDHRFYAGQFGIEEDPTPALGCFWSDGANLYALIYADKTAQQDQNAAALQKILDSLSLRDGAQLPDQPPEQLSLSGTGAYISDTMALPAPPMRVHFAQESPGAFEVWSTVTGKSTEVLTGGSGDREGTSSIQAGGSCEILVEAQQPWTLTLETLKEAPFEAASGSGDWISDLYTFEKSFIVSFDARYPELNHLSLSVYTETKYGWERQLLLNELEDEGTQKHYEKLVQLEEPTRLYFALDFDAGEWKLDLK